MSTTTTWARQPLALLISALALALAITTVGLVGAEAGPPSSRKASERTVVGKTSQGRMVSKVVGETAGGKKVTGSFTPVKFVKKNGKVKVRGLLSGTTTKNGKTQMFSGIETLRVKKINGHRVTSRTTLPRAECDVLNLVLAPLDLDLLGLQVHLDRVVLRVVAVSGAGNLLGNLLCAVTGLLDGGLDGLLGRLRNLLNDILGALRMGV